MAWEDNVKGIVAYSDARKVYDLVQQWDGLRQAFFEIAMNLDTVKAAPAATYPGWRGKSADAFVAYAEKLRKEAAALRDEAEKISRSLDACATDLCEAIANTPIPLFSDRDLPGGVDVERLVKGDSTGLKSGDRQGDIGTMFAERVRADIDKAPQYYLPGGFMVRARVSIR